MTRGDEAKGLRVWWLRTERMGSGVTVMEVGTRLWKREEKEGLEEDSKQEGGNRREEGQGIS